MIGEYERFDTKRRPTRQWPILTVITWLLCFPVAWAHRSKVNKTGMPKGLKPPYFLLCNHNAFLDFLIMTTAIFPYRANYVVAIDGFIGIEWLLRAAGGIGNRKFTRSISLVKNMLHVRDNGNIIVLFPEARYSLCGTSAVLPASLGKMVRKMNIPVVTLILHGHHINTPFWNPGHRHVMPLQAEMKQLFSTEEIQKASVVDINEKLREAFQYDDYAWQKENGIRIKHKQRAKGLHRLLYQCPACHTEYRMISHDTMLECQHCGMAWELTELGELRAQNGETVFSHIPDWYEWQRDNVRKELQDGRYAWEGDVRIESLPNAKGFVPFDEPGHLIHDMNGFTLSGRHRNEPFTIHWAPSSLYSCHIEYDYKGRGDCVDLSTLEDSFYLFPMGQDFSITKLALATEELYHIAEEP